MDNSGFIFLVLWSKITKHKCFDSYAAGFISKYGAVFSKNTVEPLSKGHVGTRSFVLYRKLSFIWRQV